MSVVLGLAVSNVVVIAADTRLNATFRDGRLGVHDEGPLELTYPDGRRLKIGGYYRKIRPSGKNWAGGAGFLTLVQSALSTVANVTSWPQAKAALAAHGKEQIAQVVRDFPNQTIDGVSRTAILYAHFESGRAALDGYRFDDTEPFRSAANFALITPPELAPETVAHANQRLQDELRTPTSVEELFATLQTVASTFHNVHRYSESVSDHTEFGVTALSQPMLRFRLAVSNQAMMNATVKDIRQLVVRL